MWALDPNQTPVPLPIPSEEMGDKALAMTIIRFPYFHKEYSQCQDFQYLLDSLEQNYNLVSECLLWSLTFIICASQAFYYCKYQCFLRLIAYVNLFSQRLCNKRKEGGLQFINQGGGMSFTLIKSLIKHLVSESGFDWVVARCAVTIFNEFVYRSLGDKARPPASRKAVKHAVWSVARKRWADDVYFGESPAQEKKLKEAVKIWLNSVGALVLSLME